MSRFLISHSSFLLLRRPLLRLVLVVAGILVIAALGLVAAGEFTGFPRRPGSFAASFLLILDFLFNLLAEFGIRGLAFGAGNFDGGVFQ